MLSFPPWPGCGQPPHRQCAQTPLLCSGTLPVNLLKHKHKKIDTLLSGEKQAKARKFSASMKAFFLKELICRIGPGCDRD